MTAFFLLVNSVYAININISNIIDPIGRMFSGGTDPNTGTYVTGIFEGDPMLLGAFIFSIFLILTLILGLGMLIGSVVLIPSLFAIFHYIPDLRIVVAILTGLLFGMALHRLVRR